MMYELVAEGAQGRAGGARDRHRRSGRRARFFRSTKTSSPTITMRDFVCDTMRMAVSGGVEVFDIDQMLETDMEVHHHGAAEPVAALSTTADSLPGAGHCGGGAGSGDHDGRAGRTAGRDRAQSGGGAGGNVPGHSAVLRICRARSPRVWARMRKKNMRSCWCMRVVMVAFLKGVAPIMAVEIGRRVVPGHVRPSFKEVEEACRNRGASGAANALPLPQREPAKSSQCQLPPSSSSRKKADMAAITAARGRLRMPIS